MAQRKMEEHVSERRPESRYDLLECAGKLEVIYEAVIACNVHENVRYKENGRIYQHDLYEDVAGADKLLKIFNKTLCHISIKMTLLPAPDRDNDKTKKCTT